VIQLETATLTDIGMREVNQDSIFAKIEHIGGNAYGLFCVADGMGGLSDGQYASSNAINIVEHWWVTRPSNLLKDSTGDSFNEEKVFKTIYKELYALFLQINKTILHHSQEKDVKIGTTCSLLFIWNSRYHIIHAGDTRIYITQGGLFRKKQIRQLTDDHSWGAEQLRLGKLSIEEIEDNPGKDKLISCLGTWQSPVIFTTSGYIEQACSFIVCSDGLYQIVGDSDLMSVTTKNDTCEKLTKKLMDIVKKRGIQDNASVIVTRIKGKFHKSKDIDTQQDILSKVDTDTITITE